MIVPVIIGFFLKNEEMLDIFGEKYESILKSYNVLYSFKGNGFAIGVLKSPEVDGACRPIPNNSSESQLDENPLADLKKLADKYPTLKTKNFGYFIL